MDKYELLGFLLHNLRNDPGPDEEDIDAPRLRETTRIFELMVRHGHLTRDMFDPRGIASGGETLSLPEKYDQWQQANYPITFVVFAD